MKKVALSELKTDLSCVLARAQKEEVVITRRGKPVGVLVGFATEDDWFDYVLENHPAFQRRVAKARRDLRAGRGIPLEDIDA